MEDGATPSTAGSAPNRGGPRAGHTLVLGPGISVTYLPIPDSLRGVVLTLVYFSSDLAEMADMFPAMPGFLSFTLRGAGWRELPKGARTHTFAANLLGSSDRAARIGAKGPFHAVCAVLSPLGWAGLTGLDAALHADTMYDAGKVLGPQWSELAQHLQDEYAAGNQDPAGLIDQIAAMITAELKPIDPRHAAMIRETGQWLASSLDPPLADLYRRCSYSQRQVQRLVERYFGSSPKVLVRKFRALRVFAMLLSPTTDDTQASAVIDLYYDQSHLIREFQRFVGRTPKQLQAARLPLLSAMVTKRNMRAIWPKDGAQPSD